MSLSFGQQYQVNQILALQGESISNHDLFPVTDKLFYTYDYGDNWNITITKYKDCDDLICNNMLGIDEFEAAEEIVIDKHMPICIYRAGISVLDDVGGLSGFANFLGSIYEEDDKAEASHLRQWARSLGWNAAKVSPKKIL